MRYAAIALVRQRSWEMTYFLHVTMTVHDTEEEADTEVRAFIARSGPRGKEWSGAYVERIKGPMYD